jgi:hypothetical protein
MRTLQVRNSMFYKIYVLNWIIRSAYQNVVTVKKKRRDNYDRAFRVSFVIMKFKSALRRICGSRTKEERDSHRIKYALNCYA